MSHVIRQELSGTVKALAEHLKIADQYIDHIKSKPSPEDETQLAITIEMELFINNSSEQKQNEEVSFLSNYFTGDEQCDKIDPAEDWPVTRLLNRANDIINKLKAYVVLRLRTDTVSNNSPKAPSMHGSIAGDDNNQLPKTPFVSDRSQYTHLENEFDQQMRTIRQNNDLNDFRTQFGNYQQNIPNQFAPFQTQMLPNTPVWNALKVDSVRLPTFGGDIREWRTFWAAFEHAVDQQPYPLFQKHLLLLQNLREGSSAREAVSGYPPSDINYPIVKSILLEKYGNDDQLSDQLEAQLLKLQPIRNNLRELSQFQKEVERICLQLESLGGQNQRFLCNIIKSKLPHGILQQLITEELHSKRKWDDKSLRKALTDIVKIRQATEECMNSFQNEPRKEQPRDQNCASVPSNNQSLQIRQTRKWKQNEQPPHQNSFTNRQNSNNFKPKLTGANATTLNNHKPVTTLSVINEESDEKEHLKSESDENTSNSSSSVTYFNADLIKNENRTHLMTLNIQVSCLGGPKEGIPAMVFFDSGSQTSYITKELADQLQPPEFSEETLRIHTFANKNPKTIRSLLVSVQLKRQDNKWESIQLNTINEISTKMESYQFTGKHDQIEPVTGTPSILIGIREFWNFVMGFRQIGPKLYKIQTIFGDVLGGESCLEKSNYSSTFMSINDKKSDHSNDMENFWALETLGIKENPEEKDDDTAMRLFKQSIRQKSNGTYTVHVQNELHRQINSVHFWLDSRIVLSWIQSSDVKPQFEQRRITEIRKNAKGTFHFVRTIDNSADLSTRGTTPQELQNSSLWWNGPKFLRQPAKDWPNEYSFDIKLQDDEIEESDTNTYLNNNKQTNQPKPPIIDPTRGPNDLGAIDCDLDCEEGKLSGPEKLAAIWKAYREAADVFWERWSQEYILTIRERAGWHHKGPKSQAKFLPSIGQIVLVEMDLRPRNLWPLAKIVKLNGSTNEVRSVDLLIGDGKVITRPISRLCPLETEIKDSTNEIPKETIETNQREESLKDTTTSEKPARTHKMILRNQTHPIKIKATTALLTLVILALIGFPVLSTTTPWYRCGQFDYSCLIGLSSIITALSVYRFECETCELQCSNRGVVVKSPIEVQKTAVCCMNNCIDHSNLKEYTYEIAHEILVNDYTCEAWFWANSQNSISKKIECPAVNECDLFNCYFCLEQKNEKYKLPEKTIPTSSSECYSAESYLETHSVFRRQVFGATVVDSLRQLASTTDILRDQQVRMFLKCLLVQAGVRN
uniref:DUF5641 domain-containing protein n=1 Tax=Meloidogyne javanica TaxID=6303 RepID=A0A915N8I6_MELJA